MYTCLTSYLKYEREIGAYYGDSNTVVITHEGKWGKWSGWTPYYTIVEEGGVTIIKGSCVGGGELYESSTRRDDAVSLVFIARHNGFKKDHFFFDSLATFKDQSCFNYHVGNSVVDIVTVRLRLPAAEPISFVVDRMEGEIELYVVSDHVERLEARDVEELASKAALIPGIGEGVATALKDRERWHELATDEVRKYVFAGRWSSREHEPPKKPEFVAIPFSELVCENNN